MKKILALLSAALMLFAVAGCSQEGDGSSTPSGDASTGEVQAMPAVSKEELKVGVIHIGNPSDGAGYSFAHDEGIKAMQKELGLSDSQIIRKNNIPDTDVAKTRTAIEECIEEGCQVIFGTSFNYMNTMKEMADEHPDVIFSHGTGYINNGKNMNNYFGRIYQARYLSGVVAGLKTKTNKIGYVAAMDSSNAEVTGGIDAFAMGIKAVNPDAKVYVKVTNTWFDVNLEGQAAEALLDMGCDVIGQHCDTTAPQLAAEKRGVWGCGYNSDMTAEAPKAHLTAPIWNWDVYYTTATKQVIEGTWKAVNYFGGMKEGFVDISPLNPETTTEEMKTAVDTVKQMIINDEYKVFEGKVLDGKNGFTATEQDIKDNQGNVVIKAGEVLDDATITGQINWYLDNVEVK